MRKKEELLLAVIKEIELFEKSGELVETIYFGGGTPSLLDANEIGLLLGKVYASFAVTPDVEITLEANPDDINGEKLTAWKASGINRLSIGVQSFFEEDLRWMNRAHNAQQAIDSLKLAMQYFENITIDLIYGVPGLTNERWRQNVQTTVDLGIPHLSCYALTVEAKTPLDKLIRTNKKPDVVQEQQSEQFLLLMDWLIEVGYEHYEISNFAKPGFRSRHNSSYWQGKNYYGFGPGAHSFNGVERRWNISNNQKYIDSIRKDVIPFEKEVLTDTQKLNEYIMISLRTAEGINISGINPSERDNILKSAQKFIVQGLVRHEKDHLILTNEGKLFADGIAAELFNL